MFAPSGRGFGLGFAFLLVFALLLGGAGSALALNCSEFENGVIDGNLVSAPDQVQIDRNCTIKNFPFPNVLGTNFSFYTQPGGNEERWLVVFDNVVHTGNMSCNSTHEHRIWFTNGSSTKIQEGCQNLLIPVEKIDKRNPPGQTAASVGVPFTYNLTIPVLYDAGTGTVINNSGSLNQLHGITITDDLNATGVDLTYISHEAYWKDTGTPVTPAPIFTNTGGLLTFEFPPGFIIPAQDQIVIEITVVLQNMPANTAGTQFVNTAKWEFGRLIDGVFYEPLPGEWGISQPMTIAEPNLTLEKTGSLTTINVDSTVEYTLDVQNVGGSDAWNVTITDATPPGMSAFSPVPTVTARIFASDGVTPVSAPLVNGTDYTLTWSGGSGSPGQLTLTLSDTTRIAPTQRLIITYQSQIDSTGIASGEMLTNVAGATQWFSADSSRAGRRQYDRILTDGTPGVLDYQDAWTVSAAFSGYYFQKTVRDLTTGTYPVAYAYPGDGLRYTLLLQNFTWPPLNNITITDQLPAGLTSISNVTVTPAGGSVNVIQPVGGTPGSITITGLNLPGGEDTTAQIQIEFDAVLDPDLANGTVVSNQANLTGTDSNGTNWAGPSDDPYVNGTVLFGSGGDPTIVTIQAPGALAKENPATATATIGQEFSYLVTVPATPTNVPLYDVRILDDLGLSGADLRFVGASVVSGGTWSLSNSGSATDLVIEDLATGIDIPANGQMVIEITVGLQNTLTNQAGLSFNNSASYTYNRANGDNTTRTAGSGDSTGNMTVVEPELTATKAVRFVSPAGKAPTDPAAVGDVLEYEVTIVNSGTSTAFDTGIVDALPDDLSPVPDSATASINGGAVAGFVVEPTLLPDGSFAWGRQNGDLTLDIPAGQSLVLTYQVTVDSVSGADIVNSVYVDWTSLDGAHAAERTGADCPVSGPLDNYCFGPVTAAVTTLDNTSIAKAAVGDSYPEIPAATSDPVVRVGDTVTYELTLNLREFVTRNVVVEDALPEGLALESFTINGGANFSYTLGGQPTAGDTGTLRWELGDITNQPSNDGTPIDALVIQYVAKVVIDAPPVGVAEDTSIPRDNLAKLSYTGGDPAVHPDRLTATETIDVRQPRMRAISKVDTGSGRVGSGTAADPYQVNIATDVMNFQLSSCNDGLAPAYGVVVIDQLASELDESDLVTNPPVVRIGGTTLTAGTDYTLTLPGRGGELRIALLDGAPVNPGECVTVDYSIGFHTDLTGSTTWSNEAQLPEYRSLPLAESGRLYTSGDQAEVWMTNLVNVEQLLKTLISPAGATIGEEVVYRITVPAVPMNRALDNVVVVDTLHGALEYVGATAVDNDGAAVTLTDSSVAPGQVNLGIARIPAGEQVIITLRARVANNDQANAGVSVTNTASYIYDGMPDGLVTASTSAPLTIVEPTVAIAKTVANLSNPGAAPNVGDILRYSLSFTADGGAGGDNFSDAFDLLIEDTLSLGLAYQTGTATVDGTGNTIADPTVTGDGSTTVHTLIWSPAAATADIDIVEGTVVTVTYDVAVLAGVQPGQDLTNSAMARWTGLDGDNALERTGTGTPAENDYFTEPATTTTTAALAVSMVKSVVNATTGENPGANAEPGDILRYTLVLTNQSIAPLTNASLTDDLAPYFAPGTLQQPSVSDAGADTTNTDPFGGANGTGIVDIRNLTLAAGGTVTIEFEARLAPVISSGTAVLNRALLTGDHLSSATSNETSTLIHSAPAFEVWKTSRDLTGDPAELMAGDTLRYTITVKNIGNENAVNTLLQDQIPANTTYVANSTTLNGSPVVDPAAGASPLQNGLRIHAPENATPGAMRADATATTANVATVTFDVVINGNVVAGTIISNQGFVTAEGSGSGPAPEEPSDDPDTPILNDPTVDVVGKVPLVDAHKTVAIVGDGGSPGIVDPEDVLRYTIAITNVGTATATGVAFSDAVPVNTTYVADSVRLNGLPVGQPDGGVSPLVAGIAVSSGDLTPPLPGPGEGTLAPGSTAVVTFNVQVNAGVPAGTIVSNQGTVSANGLLDEPTDADGIDSNGDQPTDVVVGDAQQLTILKEVFVVGGGQAEPGSQLEYVIRVANIGSLPATNVVVTDDLGSLAGQVTYVAGWGRLNGSTVGVTYAGSVFSADYGAQYGVLPAGAAAVVRFRVAIAPAVPIGTTITNTGVVSWNSPAQTASAEVSLAVGGTPGSAALNGRVWHDANLSKVYDGGERPLEGWTVELYRNSQLLASTPTGGNGTYRFSGLAANAGTTELYELRFRAAGAGPNTPSLGTADSVFINGPQRISGITVSAGGNLSNLNLPIWPNGTVYNSIVRAPIAGASLALVNAVTGAALPGQCFDDPVQQNQLTAADGFYKFDLNFSDAACPAGGAYLIDVTPPASGYLGPRSQVIPPDSDESTAAFSVPACPGNGDDAVPATTDYCESTGWSTVPPTSVLPRTAGTRYQLHLLLDSASMPGQSQIFNNSIPIDPVLDGAVAITKTSSLINVTRGELVPYTITVTNVFGVPLSDLSILDRFPAGFKYVADSARLEGTALEPRINGRELIWDNLQLQVNESLSLQFLLVVGSGVSEGEYVNRALALNSALGTAVSGEATATVRVVPDPDFDCTDVIGKVFDDRNLNGWQEEGESGLPGARLVTARGLIATTDEYGRFHIACATVPDQDRGSNFILKLDERSLPTGYRLTTENPRVQRATRGKALRFNFGATIHRVVRIDIADGAFEPGTTELRLQWQSKIDQLLAELMKGPAVLRLSYLGDVESAGLVEKRLEALKKELTGLWKRSADAYRLDIETEVFWHRGGPPGR